MELNSKKNKKKVYNNTQEFCIFFSVESAPYFFMGWDV